LEGVYALADFNASQRLNASKLEKCTKPFLEFWAKLCAHRSQSSLHRLHQTLKTRSIIMLFMDERGLVA